MLLSPYRPSHLSSSFPFYFARLSGYLIPELNCIDQKSISFMGKRGGNKWFGKGDVNRRTEKNEMEKQSKREERDVFKEQSIEELKDCVFFMKRYLRSRNGMSAIAMKKRKYEEERRKKENERKWQNWRSKRRNRSWDNSLGARKKRTEERNRWVKRRSRKERSCKKRSAPLLDRWSFFSLFAIFYSILQSNRFRFLRFISHFVPLLYSLFLHLVH